MISPEHQPGPQCGSGGCFIACMAKIVFTCFPQLKPLNNTNNTTNNNATTDQKKKKKKKKKKKTKTRTVIKKRISMMMMHILISERSVQPAVTRHMLIMLNARAKCCLGCLKELS